MTNWYAHFFQVGAIPSAAMYGEYDLPLVFLSYVIASLASYVALDMSAHLRKPTSTLFWICWLAMGSLIMGAGIWSMHFVGMLAFKMQMPMSYNFWWTGVSMIVAVITAAIAFLFFIIKKPQIKHYLMSGIILGIAIPTMHYTGMAGMNNVVIHYKLIPFLLSILVAIIAAMAALWLSIKSDVGGFGARLRLKLGSALIMGLAIVGMHYVGMYAAVFTSDASITQGWSLDPTLLSIYITVAVVFITIIGLVLSVSKYLMTTAIEKEKDFLAAVLNHITGAVLACDPKGNVILTNPALEKMFGPFIKNATSVEMSERFPLYKINETTPLEDAEHPLNRALNGESVNNVELIHMDQNNMPHYLLVEGQGIVGREQEKLGAVLVYYDISTLKENEAELEYRATHDILTGLPNRNLLLDRLKHSIALSGRQKLKTIIVFLDLDGFKFINDALGHSIGDLLLQEVANRLHSSMRLADTVARIGGDEFVIVLNDQKDIYGVTQFAKKILDVISKPYTIEDHDLRITGSLGISVSPENGINPEILLKYADTAMYQAKEAGRNTFKFYTDDMYQEVKKRLDMENNLRKAIVNNEFFLEYQPKLDVRKNKLVGYEALVRWRHPRFGTVYPKDFIHIAENTGLILALGAWVLKTACAQNKAWQDAGLPPLCVSVNLSSRQCKESNLMEEIKNILDETGLDPKYLELELTESLAMSNPAAFMKMLTECKNLGIKTSIDDFGTGYSSLDYLRKFPVNTLKIDQTFIRELVENKSDMSIVRAIISLGHSLDLNVIAEGVETKGQMERLIENGCDEIQGYYLARPMPAEEMPRFIRNNEREQ